MRRTTLLMAAGTMLLFPYGCVNREAQQQAAQTEKITTSTVKSVLSRPVETTSLTETLEVTGQIVSSQDTQIGPKSGGKLTGVYVQDGDSVKAGQVIASQDLSTLNSQLSSALASASSARSQLDQAIANAKVGPTKSSSQVDAARAQLKSARAALAKAQAGARTEERSQADWNVKSAQSNLDTAKKELDRQQMLFTQGAGTQQSFEKAQSAYDGALSAYNSAVQAQLILSNGNRKEDILQAQEAVRAAEEQLRQALAQKKLDVLFTQQVQSAQAAVQSAQAQVSIAQTAIADAQIRAPFSGKISGRPLQVGTVVSPGTPIVRLVGDNGLYFEAEVPEDKIAKIAVGSKVQITLQAQESQKLPGTVSSVNPVGSDIGRLFKIRVSMAGGSPLPGMFGRGLITLRTIDNAVVVPVSSIVKRDGKDVVFLARDNKAHMVPVEKLFQLNDKVQVSGVSAGQPLIIQGQDQLVEGTTIALQTNKSAASGAANKEG